MASPTSNPTTPIVSYYIDKNPNDNLIDLTTPKHNNSKDGWTTPPESLDTTIGDLGTKTLFSEPNQDNITPKNLTSILSNITKTVDDYTNIKSTPPKTPVNQNKDEKDTSKKDETKTEDSSAKKDEIKTEETSVKKGETKTEATSAKKDETKKSQPWFWTRAYNYATGAAPSQTPTPTAPVKSASKEPSLKSVSSESEEVLEQETPTEDNTTTPATPAPILADAAWKKFVTIIPVVGLLSNVINQKSLRNHMDQNVGLEKKAWEIKRQYHGLSIARSMLEMAIIAKIVAMGILGINIGIAIASIPLILLATHIYKCVQANKESKKYIDTKPVTTPTEQKKEIEKEEKDTDSDTVVVG